MYRSSEEVLIATAKDHITEATIKAVREAIYNFKNSSYNTSKNDSGFDSDLERTPRMKGAAGVGSVASKKPGGNVSSDAAQKATVKSTSPSRLELSKEVPDSIYRCITAPLVFFSVATKCDFL